jgi:hypothetical protein
MKKMFSSLIVVMFLMMVLPINAAVISAFDSDSEGWWANGDVHGMAWSSTVGNPPGSFHAVDDATGDIWYFIAPSKFLGNKSSYYGQTLSYDINISARDGSDWGSPDILLTGNGLTLAWYDAFPVPGQWSSYTVSLTETGGWLNLANSLPATQSEMLSVLSDIGSLWIRGEYLTGGDNAYLDNVIMTPEPASLLLLGLGGLLFRYRK